MKKILSLVMVLVMCVSTVGAIGVTASAASYPNLSTSAYCEFTAAKNMNVYVDANFSRRGTASPWKAYNAYVEKGDVCRIYEFNKYYVKLGYPTSSGMRTGYVRTSDLLGKNVNPYDSFKATSKQTTYKYKGGGKSGYYENGDAVYLIDGTNYNVMYTAVSGARKFKLAYVNNLPAKNQETSTSWQYPVASKRVTQVFGHKTNYPPTSSRTHHAGIDMATSSTNKDKNIRAASNGVVKKTGFNEANGNYVVIQHSVGGKTVYSFYAHLSQINVSAGKSVNKSTVIGVMGKTGRSFGEHLHFAICDTYKAGSYVGYVPAFSGNKTTYNGITFYNPEFVINYGYLP